MKLVILFAVVLFFATAECGRVCKVEDGLDLHMYSGNRLKMKIPCKYNMIDQKCGDYRIRVSPGNKFVYPSYIVNTVWLAVYDTDTNELLWEGRTTNKMAAMHIIKGGARDAYNKRGGSRSTDSMFTITRTTKDVTLKTKTGNGFSLTLGPFDFNGNMHSDSRLIFECNSEPQQVDYPKQLCGSDNADALKDRIENFYDNKKRLELLLLHDVLMAPDVVQMDPLCIEAVHITKNVCDEDSRKEAITACHLILDSAGHTECVVKHACDPMLVFVNCLDYVCGGYNKSAPSCEALGQAIDMCRDFPGLTERVKEANCYRDLLTAEDNPFYPKNIKKEAKESQKAEEKRLKEEQKAAEKAAKQAEKENAKRLKQEQKRAEKEMKESVKALIKAQKAEEKKQKAEQKAIEKALK